MLDYDLHCHSTYSDGTLTPTELAARAAERGVKTLALTDHDELEGLAEARHAAELRELDRIEIYRPLIADPKEVRRKRAEEGKAMKKGGGDA